MTLKLTLMEKRKDSSLAMERTARLVLTVKKWDE